MRIIRHVAAATLIAACGTTTEVETVASTTSPVTIQFAAAPNPLAPAARQVERAAQQADAFTRWVNAVLFRKWVEGVTLNIHPCRNDVERAIRQVFVGTGRTEFFIDIAWRESRCNPLARNPNGGKVDSGVFQLRMPTHAHRVRGCDVFETWCNVRGARSLYNECSIGPWDKAGGYWCSRP